MSLRIAGMMCGSLHHTMQVHRLLSASPAPAYSLLKHAWLQWHTHYPRALHTSQPARCSATEAPSEDSPETPLPAALYLVATPIGTRHIVHCCDNYPCQAT